MMSFATAIALLIQSSYNFMATSIDIKFEYDQLKLYDHIVD